MTNQKKIQFIRERCIEANPSIKKLEFGCEVEWKGAGASKGIFIKDKRDDSKSYLFYGSDRVETFDKEQCKEHVSIIGRPIRLADMLLAFKSENILAQVDTKGQINFQPFKGDTSWNLLKDNLQDQSPETIDFIYSLLTKES